eukprot:tig00020816_g14124.t1
MDPSLQARPRPAPPRRLSCTPFLLSRRAQPAASTYAPGEPLDASQRAGAFDPSRRRGAVLGPGEASDHGPTPAPLPGAAPPRGPFRRKASTHQVEAEGAGEEEEDAPGTVSAELEIAGVHVSVFSNHASEVLHLAAEGIVAAVKLNGGSRQVVARVASLQCDNCRFMRPGFQVLFGPPRRLHRDSSLNPGSAWADIARSVPTAEGAGAALEFGLEQAAEGGEVVHLREIYLTIAPLDLRLHEELIVELIRFCLFLFRRLKADLSAIAGRGDTHASLPAPEGEMPGAPGHGSPLVPPPKRVYIESLLVAPLELFVTVKASPSASVELRRYHFMADLLHDFGAALLNLEKVPLAVGKLEASDAYGLPEVVLLQFAMFYRAEVRAALGQVLGRLDILGDPLALLDGVKGGLRDVLSSTQMLLTSRMESSAGLSEASRSLALSILAGTARTTHKIAGTLAKAALFGPSRRSWFARAIAREELQVPLTPGEGARQGAKILAIRAAGAVAGLVSKPVWSARRRGPPAPGGAALAFAGAALGLAVQPALGAFAALAKLSEGLAHAVEEDAALREDGRARVPRTCGYLLNVAPFDPALSAAREALVRSDLMQLKDDDRLFESVMVCEHDLVAVTALRLHFLTASAGGASWTAELERVACASVVRLEQRLRLVEGVRLTLATHPPAFLFIPCAAEVQRRLLACLGPIVAGSRWTASFPEC